MPGAVELPICTDMADRVMGETALERARSVSTRLRHVVPALAGGFLVWLLMSARVVALVRDPSDRWVSAVPDDAFYYFQLARNAALLHRWTFDGSSATSGFHPLWAYALTGLHLVAGDLDGRTLLLVLGLVSALGLGVAAALTCTTATHLLGPASVPLVVAVFAAPVAVMQASFLMESWIACLVAAAIVLVVTREGAPRRAVALGVVALGVVGSVTRTDFGVVVVALLVGFLVAARGSLRSDGIRRSGLALAGVVAGLGLVALQDLAVSGTVLQTSVRVKQHWTLVPGGIPGADSGALAGFDKPLTLLARVFTQVPPLDPASDPHPLLWLVGLVLLGAGIAWGVRLRVRSGDLPAMCQPLVAGCLATVAGYLLLYSRDGEVQLWYAANLLVPCSLLLAATGVAVLRQRVLAPGIALAALAVTLSAVTLTSVPYPNQVSLLRAGTALRDAPDAGTVGAWNAGIIGFTADRGVVNLDGLVNDDAAAYVLRDDLAGYVHERGVGQIVDFRYMTDSPWARARGGYADGRLETCLGAPTATYDIGAPDADLSVLLRTVRPGCL